MNHRSLYFLFYMATWLFPTAAGCYELATHGGITLAAYERSVLKDASFRATLGLPETSQPWVGTFLCPRGFVILE
jgi:hypothetical protein